MNRSRPFDYIFLMSLLILAYVFAKFQGGFVSWFLFYAFLPIALYSLLYHFFVFRLITVERRVNKRIARPETVWKSLTQFKILIVFPSFIC